MSEQMIKKMNTLMYYLIKGAASDSFAEFLEGMDISDEEYDQIKAEWAKIGITKTYV